MPDPLDPPPVGGGDPLDVSLEDAAAAIVAQMVSSAEVLSLTKERTATGGWTESTSTAATYACNLSKATRYAFSESQGRVVGTSVWECQFPLAAKEHVRPGANVRIDSGEVWNVLETDEGLSGALCLTASMQRSR